MNCRSHDRAGEGCFTQDSARTLRGDTMSNEKHAPAAEISSATTPSQLTGIILAAGEGTRMKSKHAKVAHEILGRPMIQWVVEAAREAGCTRIIVVVGSHADEVRALLADQVDVECVEQTERLGTGHAIRVALEQAGIASGPVLVLCGDTPLLRGATLANLVRTATAGAPASSSAAPAAAIPGANPADAAKSPRGLGGALLTMTYADPTGYGRVMLDADGLAERIVEQKDCAPEQALVTTCNAGVYCFDAALLAVHVGDLTPNNAQHEYYITDLVSILREAGAPLAALSCEDPDELMGVNSRVQLAQATRAMQGRINDALMAQGVTMVDPASVWVGPDVRIGRDTTILPQVMLMGATTIGEDCLIGPNTRLTDTEVGERCALDETVAVSALIDNDVECGPRAYLRPGAHLMDGSKAGTHVEIKKSTIGRGSKVPHLSYVGDATIGEDVNLGAGTITCNYDGRDKYPTAVGDRTFVGSSTMLVAPVTLGADVTVGAGSVITSDVPDGSLAVARGRQIVKEGWLPRWKRDEARSSK